MADDDMTTAKSPPDAISADLIDTICDRLAKNQRVRRFLPEKGNVHLERRLPFLCLYRRPPDRSDPGTRSLIAGQSAHLIAPGGKEHQAGLQDLLSRITAQLGEAFGAFLLLEVWTARTRRPESSDFLVVAPHDEELPIAVQKLADALREVPTASGNATVEIQQGRVPAPPSLPALLPPEHLKRFAVLSLGLELQPLFRDPSTGEPFPRILRSFRRNFSIALQRGFYEFVRLETTHRPANYHVLGRGAVLRVVWEADRALADVNETFDFLLAVTPYNLLEAWESFQESGFRKAPAFRYRSLTFDPALLKRRLYNIVLDPLEDPALADLFRDKRNELDLQLTMLENRETPRFLYGSLQLYGAIDGPLRKLAEGLLAGIPPSEDGEEAAGAGARVLDAAAFARLARAEVAAYREMARELDPSIEIRDDVTSLMVSRGNLLIAADTRILPSRATALIQHEVGTHMLTYFNATAQPLRLLRCGLPGYEHLQEGLAVLAEFLVGGLSHARLRLLAARVLVSDRCMRGATFVDAFRMLHREHGFSPRTAFQVTMRVYRGGGFVKDQLYLKGLAQLLRYLGADGALRPLWVGKIGFDHVPVVEELLWRGVLEPPRLKPRYLEMNGAREKLESLRKGISVLDLISKEEEWRSASS
jgi:uncharacterized protein (TIGR02421 family)